MSLIVCSNIKDENDYDEKDENRAPYRFQNSLKQTFRIPPNSEVAVQSVKVNKSATYNISRNDKWYQYWGPELLPLKKSSDDTIYRPIMAFPKISGDRSSENVGMNGFIQRVEDAMNVGFPHPDFYGLQKLKVNRDSISNEMLGYKVESLAPEDLATEQVYSPYFNEDGNWDFIWDSADVGLTFTPGNQGTGSFPIISRTAPLAPKTKSIENTLELRNMPLSHKRGEMVVDIKGLYDGGGHTISNFWQIGLTREIDRKTKNTGNSQYGDPDNFDDRFSEGFVDADGQMAFGSFFFDIVVTCEGLTAGGTKKLKVHHATSTEGLVGGDDAPTIALQEIDYYSWAGAPAEWGGARYDIKSNTRKMSKLTFRIENEIVSIIATLDDSAGDGTNVAKDVILVSYHQKADGAGKENYPIPFGQIQWNMYPRFIINGIRDGSTARQVSIESYKTNPHPTYNNYAFNNPDNSWITRMGRNLEFTQISEMNRRIQYHFRDLGLTDAYVYQGLTYDVPAAPTKITAWKTTGATGEDRNWQIITAPATLYYRNTSGANLAPRLGFEDDPILVNSHNGVVDGTNPLLVTFVSSSLPSAHQTKSMFVRLDNMAQQSLNAAVGRPSKILYHIPRFDDSGRDSGVGLYFEPTERTYVKLNNSENLYMNEIQLSISNDDEKLAFDLVGKTIVCLHIQNSK